MLPRSPAPPSPESRPRVLVCVPVEDGDEARLGPLVAELERSRAVELELVLADLTASGALARRGCAGARVVRARPGSRGDAYRAALRASDAPFVAWQLAGAHAPAGRLALLAHALARSSEALLATSDLLVRDPGVGERLVSLGAPHAPPSCWETAVMTRREALADIDRTSFAPAELALFQRLHAAGRCVHVDEPLAAVPAALQASRAARTAQDAELVARDPWTAAPEITVLLATHERREVLFSCLEAFSRQLLEPGRLELVVVDDGSTDGTAELCAELALPVPFRFLRQAEPGGASRARALGLPHARGRLVLFVNDDTLPRPDTVRRHLEAHAELAPRRVVVLGTFEQPEAHLCNALMRLLESTHFVFGYAGLCPGQELDGGYLYTCNASVELEAVRAVGGFDPAFRLFAEDTELGVRLEQAGIPVVYRPECRAEHRHFLTFDDVRARQRVVARAHVRLLAKHPERLARSSAWAVLTAEGLARTRAAVLPHLSALEATGRTLSGVDLTALQAGGERCERTARHVAGLLRELFPKLNRIWWDQGFLDGFAEERVSGFPELVTRAAAEVARA